MKYEIVKHPQYEEPAASTVDNFLAGRCRPMVEFQAIRQGKQMSFIGNTLQQAGRMWADAGCPELKAIHTLGL